MKLPFIHTPKQETVVVGDETVGALQLPKYGSLLVSEQIEVDRVRRETQDGVSLFCKLAVQAANERNTSATFAFTALTSNQEQWLEKEKAKIDEKFAPGKQDAIASGKYSAKELERKYPISEEYQAALDECDRKAADIEELTTRYYAEIVDINTKSAQTNERMKLVLATLMLRRVEREWSEEDTSHLPNTFVSALVEFAGKEMNGWDTKSESSEPLSDSEVKKSPPESEPLNTPTGQTSTGGSNATGEVTPDLAPKHLEPALAG